MSEKHLSPPHVGLTAVLIMGLAGQLAGQSVIFQDPFDTYPTGFLSVVSDPDGAGPLPPVWAQDGCDDGKVATANPNSAPNAVTDYKDGTTDKRLAVRNRHDLTPDEIQAAKVVNSVEANCVDGTDENPLVLYFAIYLGTKASPYYYRLNRYMEITCGTDRAPTPTLATFCSTKTLNHLIPGGDGEIHGSIAVGQLAFIDPNPCDEGVQQQLSYRLTVFDGQSWRELKTENIHTCANYNFITLTIRTDTIEVKLNTTYNGTDCEGPRQDLIATLDRVYRGPFTALVMGGIPNETSGGCWNENNDPGYFEKATVLDDVLLLDGEANYVPNPCQTIGACCYDDAGGGPMLCIETTPDDCANTYNGTYSGALTSCETVKCCHDPFADYDGDGDVDQADFAALQACFTGQAGGLLAGCGCFDRDNAGAGDKDIDSDDWSLFELCASGPGIPANAACE